jgi:hypothetical protein
MRAALLVIGLIFIFSQIVSAYTVSPITVNPKGSLLQCEPVNATFVISNPQSDTNDYPSADNIELFTELDSPVWSLTLLTDGDQKVFPKQQSGRVLLSEWNLTGFNRNSSHEQIQINLAGNAPHVPQTSNKTIARILQMSEDNNPVAGSVLPVERVVVAMCCESPYCPSFLEQKIELQQFRALIDHNSTRGVDTSVAEVKYVEAQQKIDSAGSMESIHYVQIFSNLNAAKKAIADGEQALDKAWAEKEVADVEITLKKTDQILGWFHANLSTTNDDKIPAIIFLRDLAAAKISYANDEIETGNYENARTAARTAGLLANDSLNKITDRKNAISQYSGCGWCINPFSIFVLLIAGFVAIIICMAGIFRWKNRKE